MLILQLLILDTCLCYLAKFNLKLFAELLVWWFNETQQLFSCITITLFMFSL
jgi:hypothetical protein